MNTSFPTLTPQAPSFTQDFASASIVPPAAGTYIYRLENNDDIHELLASDGVNITLRNTNTDEVLTVDETFVYALKV